MEQLLNWFTQHQDMIYIVILMIFVGIEIIGRVPSVLHTPLMSGANAIHGVVIIGAIIVMGNADPTDITALILGFLAVILGEWLSRLQEQLHSIQIHPVIISEIIYGFLADWRLAESWVLCPQEKSR